MLEVVDPICPLLTLGSDRHAVCGGFDADHRCGALNAPDPLDRSHQLRFCLSAMHVECPHFVRQALADRAAMIDGLPAPSPDVQLARTRLVIDAQRARLGARRGTGLPPAARAAVAAVVVVVAASVGLATGSLQHLAALAADGRSSPVRDVSAVIVPRPASTAVAAPTTTATPVPLGTPAASASPPTAPSPAVVPTSAVLPAQTYVVQPGDTLKAIADRYGTTVLALQQANGIADQNVIGVGQLLTIP
jgi:hypothetical protein